MYVDYTLTLTGTVFGSMPSGFAFKTRIRSIAIFRHPEVSLMFKSKTSPNITSSGGLKQADSI
jgi:hypothetical protein